MLSQNILAMVDINKATEEELASELSGIGPIKARRIVEYREKINGFVFIEQLIEIKGIGLKTLARNREKIVKITKPIPVPILAKCLNIFPEKTPHQAQNLFWDALIIMPLFIVCLFIFITAWLKGAKS
jgi:competence protein ComEA